MTLAHTVNAGTDRFLIVGISYNNDFNETVSSVVWKDGLGDQQSLSLVGTVSSVDDAHVEIWSLVAPNTGTANIRVNFSPAMTFGGVVGAMSFTGVNQGTPLGTFVSNFAQSDAGPATVAASSAPGELVFGAVACESCSSLNVGPLQTERWNDVNAGRDHGAASTETGAASVDISWGLGSSDHWAIGAVPIRPSGGGGGATFAAAEDTKLVPIQARLG